MACGVIANFLTIQLFETIVCSKVYKEILEYLQEQISRAVVINKTAHFRVYKRMEENEASQSSQ